MIKDINSGRNLLVNVEFYKRKASNQALLGKPGWGAGNLPGIAGRRTAQLVPAGTAGL